MQRNHVAAHVWWQVSQAPVFEEVFKLARQTGEFAIAIVSGCRASLEVGSTTEGSPHRCPCLPTIPMLLDCLVGQRPTLLGVRNTHQLLGGGHIQLIADYQG